MFLAFAGFLALPLLFTHILAKLDDTTISYLLLFYNFFKDEISFKFTKSTQELGVESFTPEAFIDPGHDNSCLDETSTYAVDCADIEPAKITVVEYINIPGNISKILGFKEVINDKMIVLEKIIVYADTNSKGELALSEGRYAYENKDGEKVNRVVKNELNKSGIWTRIKEKMKELISKGWDVFWDWVFNRVDNDETYQTDEIKVLSEQLMEEVLEGFVC